MDEWCDCVSKGKWKKQDGWTYDPESNMWVHSTCRKPSKPVKPIEVEDRIFHKGESRKVVDIDWGPSVDEEWSWE